MIIKKNSQKYREVVKPKVVQKSVEKEPVVEESFSPEITYPQTSEEVEDNDDDFQAQPQENLPKEPEIDLFDIENIDFEQRQERRRGSRRRGYRRIDDRNLVSRAQEEAEAIKKVAEARANEIHLVYDAMMKAHPDDTLVQLKSLEALKDIANGDANKVFIPFEATSALSSLGAIKEVVSDDKKSKKSE